MPISIINMVTYGYSWDSLSPKCTPLHPKFQCHCGYHSHCPILTPFNRFPLSSSNQLGWNSPIGRPSTTLHVFAVNTRRPLGRHGSKAASVATLKVDVLKIEGMDMAREVAAED